VLRGFDGNDTIRGRAGADILDGGAGNDKLQGGLGADTMDGGTGIDTADYRDKTLAVSVILNGSTAVSVKVAGVVEDTIKNFENLQGGSGNDKLIGDGSANALFGNGGNDIVKGGGGNDQLFGGAGADLLTGGGGADKLDGGADNDTFIFTALADSGITAGTRDQINHFAAGDKIDVHLIDAIAGGGDDAFVLDAGGAFSAGEIRQTLTSNGHLLLEFNVDGDAAAEASILLLNHSTLLTTGDFVF